VVGGSPLRLFRLAPAGDAVLDRLAAGEDLRPSAAEARLLDRLVDAGAVHPLPPRPGEAALPGAPVATDVTVVVPVRDRPAGLTRLLDSLEAAPSAAGRVAEVVVVDDGSTDAEAVARAARRPGVRLLRRPVPGGPGPARHDGIAAARTAVVAAVDSDCTVEPGWLEPALAHLADRRVGAVACRVRARPGPGLLAGYDAVRSPLDLGPDAGRVAPRTRVAYVPSAALVLRVEAYRDVGGFDAELRTGEDVDLVWRLVGSGWRVRYEPAGEVLHDVRPDLRAWLAQRFTYGSSAAALDRRHPGAVAPVSCSPWSAAGWALGAAGHPVVGTGVLAASAAALPRRLRGVPAVEALRLAVTGHVGAGRLLGRAVVRVWWPIGALVAVRSRRARRRLAASGVSVAAEPRGADGRWSPRLGALAVLDDVAYGAGVWWGCLRERSGRALLPDLAGWPGRRPSSSA
jgi:mycofactocin system glycosyltransferase